MSAESTLGTIATAFEKIAEAGLEAVEGTPAPVTAPPSAPTGAQVSAGVTIIMTQLAKLQTAMASPQFHSIAVGVEDVEQILADFDVPGAAIAEQVTKGVVEYAPDALAAAQIAAPFLSPILANWLTSEAFAAAPAASPIAPNDPTQFSRGR